MSTQKKLLLIFLSIFFLSAATAKAATLTLQWQANTEPDLQSYNLYWGTESRVYGLPLPVGDVTQYTIDGLTEGETYYFAVTAVDTSGNESGYSNELEVAIPAEKTEPPIGGGLLTDNFKDGDYAGWEIVDEGTNEAPSAWQVVDGVLYQESNIYGGEANGTEPYEPGTYALQGDLAWDDYIIQLNIRSEDDDGIGVMFRYQDPDNYYLFSMGEQRNYRSLTKRSNGVVTVLAEDSTAYDENRWYTVKVEAVGNDIRVFLDGTLLFEVRDDSLSSGKIGLYSWGNQGSLYDDVSVSPFVETYFSDDFEDGDYAGWEIVDEGTNEAPSSWNVSNGVLYQQSNIYGGSRKGTEPYEPGTYALQGDLAWDDYITQLNIRSGDDDGIGVMFRYQDPDNYYLFSMGKQRNYRSLIKRNNGVVTVLAEDSIAYEENRWYSVQVEAEGSDIRVSLDGNLLFEVRDDSLSSGKIGLYSWGNEASAYDDIVVGDLTASAEPEPEIDETAPVVEIASPSGTGTYETEQASIDISGIASDNVGVVRVDWENSTGGAGTAQGTSNWSVSGIGLAEGENLITASAIDEAGNQGTDSLTVTYISPDETPPEINIIEPSSTGTYETETASVDISGTASDNVGITSVTWTDAGGKTGEASGGEAWSITGINLVEGENAITVIASDQAGNTAEETIYVYYLEPVLVFLDDNFNDGDFEGWEIVDEGINEAPSSWDVNNGILSQESNIYGGSRKGTEPYEPGTYALTGGSSWSDYTVKLVMRSRDDDGIGVMFRYQDPDNYYLFSMGKQREYRTLSKRVNGELTILAQDSVQYSEEKWYSVSVEVSGSRIRVYIDAELLFDISDASISNGRIGLYSWGNQGSDFDDIIVTPIEETIFSDDFEDGDYAGWEIVDEGTNEAPSVWQVTNGILSQQSNIYGGARNGTEPYEPGTYALQGENNWGDYTVDLDIRSGDDDGIGVMFRYQDSDNYYLFSMGKQRKYRSLTKRINGEVTVLAEDSEVYEEDRWYQIRVEATGDRIRAYLDETLLFDVLDDSLSGGKIGLYSWGNQGSDFDNINVQK